jgi:hypothetical protein
VEWLPWTDAAGMAAASVAAAPLLSASRRRWRRLGALGPWSRELAVMFGLYSLWQFAGDHSIGNLNGATGRGRAIYDFERDLHIPSEAAIQRLFLGHHLVLRTANVYYIGLHVAFMGLCLVWLFARHRDRYPLVRNVLALSTGACLLVALVPVAPPRLVSGIGVVDVGRVVGPDVYPVTDVPGLDQLSAMPSVHVAWAIVVAFAIIVAGRSAWRWAAVLYPAATVAVVVVTGNHYWSDGVVAAVIVGASIVAANSLQRLRLSRPSSEDEPAPVRTSLSGPVSQPN